MLIVSDCMVYPDSKLGIKNLGSGLTTQSDTIKKLKIASFFSEVGGCFF